MFELGPATAPRSVLLDTSEIMSDALIVESARTAFELGFKGLIGWGDQTELTLHWDRMMRLMSAIRAHVPSARFVFRTHGTPGRAGLNDLTAFAQIREERIEEAASQPEVQAEESGCLRPFEELLIDAYGNGHLCSADRMGHCHIGNVRRDGFAAVAHRFLAVRSMVAEHVLPPDAPPMCRLCPVKQRDIRSLVPEVAEDASACLAREERERLVATGKATFRFDGDVSFDWSRTARDLVLFIPNYGRKRYLRSCLASLVRTSVPRDRWLILVGNDGLDEPMDDLEQEFNLAWFTLPRADATVARNGAFIRNYVIKRCRSRFFFQKDPEVALVAADPSYDIIRHMMAIGPKRVWRNGRPYDVVFPERYVSAGAPIDQRVIGDLPPPPTPTIGVQWPGLFATHWGFCVPTDTLRNMRGYDERFVTYGPEDGDLFRRLKRLGYQFTYDKKVFAIHVHHRTETFGHEEMTDLGRRIASQPTTRNDADTWGEGGDSR